MTESRIANLIFQKVLDMLSVEIKLLVKSRSSDVNKLSTYTGGENVWCDIAKYIVKWTQEKWACDSHDDATPLSFQLQVTEDFFKSHNFFIMEK